MNPVVLFLWLQDTEININDKLVVDWLGESYAVNPPVDSIRENNKINSLIGKRNIGPRQERSITTSHVERLNGTQRTFMKRLNRLTLCFSKKLENLEAAFAMFACYYNWCWRTRKPGKSGMKRPTACMMAGITDHLWSFDELFEMVLRASNKMI